MREFETRIMRPEASVLCRPPEGSTHSEYTLTPRSWLSHPRGIEERGVSGDSTGAEQDEEEKVEEDEQEKGQELSDIGSPISRQRAGSAVLTGSPVPKLLSCSVPDQLSRQTSDDVMQVLSAPVSPMVSPLMP